jgi:hypothetical protein
MKNNLGNPRGRVIKDVGLRPMDCWDSWFESPRGLACLSVVSVVFDELKQ